jgi:hypothetical protein
MYAVTSANDVYHLLAETADMTLCGLSVVPIVIDRPVITSDLYLTSKRPLNRAMCTACAEIAEPENQTGK